MATNVEPEEAEALREALEENAGENLRVSSRDFSRPVRLSRTHLDALERRILAVLGDVEQVFESALGTQCRVEFTSVGEASAADLFHEEEAGPYAALRLDVHGELAWVVWQSPAAVRAVERVLGSTSEGIGARRLSSIEEGLMQTLLASIADGVLRAVDVEAANPSVAQTREALGDWQDAGDDADPHRLHVVLSVDGPGGISSIDVYLPIGIAKAAALADLPTELPVHLDKVRVAVSVRIPGCEIRLAQILGIEEGDVIPLDARVGDPAVFCVEGKPYAHGALGTRQGNFALRIENLDNPEREAA